MKLRIQQGRRRGREYATGRAPITIGRAPQCTIVIPDDQLVSSEHADVHVDSNGQLVLRDLESVNGTEVNGQSVQEAVLKPGDEIAIGSTVFEVIEETTPSEPAPPARSDRGYATDRIPVPVITSQAAEQPPEPEEAPAEAPVELTFGDKKPARRAPKPPAAPVSRRLMSWGLTAAIIIVIVGGLIFILSQIGMLNMSRNLVPGVSMGGDSHRLDLFYEKVQASTQNIFRFALRISGDRVTLNVDDLKQHRHIQREKKISETMVADLVRQMERGNFDNLERPKYGGLPADQQEMAVIELTRGTRVKRVEVENTIAPDAFVNAQKVLEDFAQNELGMATLSRSREELIKEADEAFLRGNQLFEQRDVDFPNLFNAIKAYQLVQVDLEIIEPKPANYTAAVQTQEKARKMLEERINNLRFNADQAMRLADWPKAQACLSEIMARIPDREDDRYREADRKLITVQGHLPRR